MNLIVSGRKGYSSYEIGGDPDYLLEDMIEAIGCDVPEEFELGEIQTVDVDREAVICTVHAFADAEAQENRKLYRKKFDTSEGEETIVGPFIVFCKDSVSGYVTDIDVGTVLKYLQSIEK